MSESSRYNSQDGSHIEVRQYNGSGYRSVFVISTYVYLDQHQRVQLLTQLAAASIGGRLGATLSTETGSMRHPLWHPAVEEAPEVRMSSTGWCVQAETMAEASASFGRPLTTPADAATSWRLVSAATTIATGPL